MKMMEILLAEAEEVKEQWYDDSRILDKLRGLAEEGAGLQCRYKDRIVILTKDGRAVFDSSGNLLELYDLKADPKKNMAGSQERTDLEFEMILLLSKFNME